jgi:hypothetical protein
MAITAHLFDLALKSAFNKEIDANSDTLKVSLHTSSYTPNRATHQYKSSLSNEITGTGYTAGGATLTTVTFTLDTSGHVFGIDADDTAWGPGATLSGVRYAVITDVTPGSDATRPLIGYVDYGTDQAITSGTFTIPWNALGFVSISVS